MFPLLYEGMVQDVVGGDLRSLQASLITTL